MLHWLKIKLSRQALHEQPQVAHRHAEDLLDKPIPVFGLESQMTFYQVNQAFNRERQQLRREIEDCVSGLRSDALDGCEVDRWLSAVAAVGYEDFLVEIHAWHEQWHLATAEVIRQANAGHFQDARLSLRQGACAYAARQFTKALEGFWVHFHQTTSTST